MVDASESTSWVYDARGRVTEESKVINGEGTFKTRWSYYADDQVKTMTYPGGNAGQTGEPVTYEYNAAGWLESVVGDDTYVQSTTYDALGRVELRKLGNDVLRRDPEYYPWTTANGRGRLRQLKAGTPSNLTSCRTCATPTTPWATSPASRTGRRGARRRWTSAMTPWIG